MCSACHLMVKHLCEVSLNMSSGFKVMEQTQKLLTHKGQLLKSRKTRVTVHLFCMSSHGV